MPPQITVIIGHCHPLFKLILQNIIRSHTTLYLLAVATTAAELLELALLHLPDVILADVALPGMNEVVTLAEMVAIRKPPRFVFSWQYHNEPLLKPIISVTPASFIVRDAPPLEYSIAITNAMRGISYCCPQTQRLLNMPGTLTADAGVAQRFSEKYLLLFYCEILGYNCKETAIATGLSEQSVKTYRKRYKKLLGSGSSEILLQALLKASDKIDINDEQTRTG